MVAHGKKDCRDLLWQGINPSSGWDLEVYWDRKRKKGLVDVTTATKSFSVDLPRLNKSTRGRIRTVVHYIPTDVLETVEQLQIGAPEDDNLQEPVDPADSVVRVQPKYNGIHRRRVRKFE